VLLLLALLCSHVALCSFAEPGKPNPKPKVSGSRRRCLRTATATRCPPPSRASRPRRGKTKKKLLAGDATSKNQTKVAKAKKPESAATAKGAAKKPAGKAAAPFAVYFVPSREPIPALPSATPAAQQVPLLLPNLFASRIQ
jgi:hypothetical protein